MKICMLTSGHNPKDGRIFYKEALSLKKSYKDINIIAPNKENTSIQGINIIGITKWRRWNRFKPLFQLYQKGKELNADVYHCHEPDSLFIGYLLKKKLKCKLIYDSHELYNESFAVNFPKFLKSIIKILIRNFEKYLIKKCDYIITVNWYLKNYYSKLNEKSKIEILFNCPSFRTYKESNFSNANYIICHEGNLTFERGLKQMIEALNNLTQHHQNIRFLIIGDIRGELEKKWFREKIAAYNLDKNVKVTNWLEYTEVGKHIAQSNIGLLLFQPLANNKIGLPNKLFNYMQNGLPVVASNFPEIGRIIRENNCGLLIDSTNIKEIIDAINFLLKHPDDAAAMGKRGQKAVKEKYNWEQMEKKLLNIYNALCC